MNSRTSAGRPCWTHVPSSVQMAGWRSCESIVASCTNPRNASFRVVGFTLSTLTATRMLPHEPRQTFDPEPSPTSSTRTRSLRGGSAARGESGALEPSASEPATFAAAAAAGDGAAAPGAAAIDAIAEATSELDPWLQLELVRRTPIGFPRSTAATVAMPAAALAAATPPDTGIPAARGILPVAPPAGMANAVAPGKAPVIEPFDPAAPGLSEVKLGFVVMLAPGRPELNAAGGRLLAGGGYAPQTEVLRGEGLESPNACLMRWSKWGRSISSLIRSRFAIENMSTAKPSPVLWAATSVIFPPDSERMSERAPREPGLCMKQEGGGKKAR